MSKLSSASAGSAAADAATKRRCLAASLCSRPRGPWLALLRLDHPAAVRRLERQAMLPPALLLPCCREPSPAIVVPLAAAATAAPTSACMLLLARAATALMHQQPSELR